ncbi:hypothetical protein Mapa_016853 [Marchantia paleacea]|nr:hypothetical protein Mapa_016853 [Marchantia paleacea]
MEMQYRDHDESSFKSGTAGRHVQTSLFSGVSCSIILFGIFFSNTGVTSFSSIEASRVKYSWESPVTIFLDAMKTCAVLCSSFCELQEWTQLT